MTLPEIAINILYTEATQEEQTHSLKQINTARDLLLQLFNDIKGGLNMQAKGGTDKQHEPELVTPKQKLSGKPMNFKQAYAKMIEGKKIARFSFLGFWYIDPFDGKMKIHDRFGNTLEKVDKEIDYKHCAQSKQAHYKLS